MNVTTTAVQMAFTRAHCATERFAPFFCRIVHKVMSPLPSTPTLGEVPDGEQYTEEDFSLCSEQTYICGTINTTNPEAVSVTVHSGDLSDAPGSGYDMIALPVQFADILRTQEDLLHLIAEGSERLVIDSAEQAPTTPVLVVVDDSRCGWVQVEKWAAEYGAIILWWPFVVDQFLENHEEGTPPPETDLWDRGRRLGYRHGFSEGYYQATKEADAKNKKKRK